MIKTYRDNGTIGALLDEYEKAIQEIITAISGVTLNQLTYIVDNKTSDEDCRSIQTILSHVIQSGYTYVLEIRKWQGEQIKYRDNKNLSTVKDYCLALQEMFKFNELLFVDYPDLQLDIRDPHKKIKARWGQSYDVNQLFSHAIVHLLKHRRQIERFIQKMNLLSI